MGKGKIQFSDQDLNAINEAIKKAESNSAVEIVPVFVGASSTYSLAIWRAWGLGFFIALLSLGSLSWFTDFGLFFPLFFWLMLLTSISTIPPALVRFWPFLKRIFAGAQLLEKTSLEKAQTKFLELDVGSTRERTGVLLFVSFFERRVHFIPDFGVSEVVSPKELQSMLDDFTTALKKGKGKEGMIKTIELLGHKFEGFGAQLDSDQNELGDELRQ